MGVLTVIRHHLPEMITRVAQGGARLPRPQESNAMPRAANRFQNRPGGILRRVQIAHAVSFSIHNYDAAAMVVAIKHVSLGTNGLNAIEDVLPSGSFHTRVNNNGVPCPRPQSPPNSIPQEPANG